VGCFVFRFQYSSGWAWFVANVICIPLVLKYLDFEKFIQIRRSSSVTSRLHDPLNDSNSASATTSNRPSTDLTIHTILPQPHEPLHPQIIITDASSSSSSSSSTTNLSQDQRTPLLQSDALLQPTTHRVNVQSVTDIDVLVAPPNSTSASSALLSSPLPALTTSTALSSVQPSSSVSARALSYIFGASLLLEFITTFGYIISETVLPPIMDHDYSFGVLQNGFPFFVFVILCLCGFDLVFFSLSQVWCGQEPLSLVFFHTLFLHSFQRRSLAA
jgi:hypothetical protein